MNDKWKVLCERVAFSKKPGNTKRTVFVRTATKERAEEVGRVVTGLRYAHAVPYHPEKDPAFGRFIGKSDAESAEG